MTDRGRRHDRRKLDLASAFARADREDAELRRLRATGRPFAGLEYRPELLGLPPGADHNDKESTT